MRKLYSLAFLFVLLLGSATLFQNCGSPTASTGFGELRLLSESADDSDDEEIEHFSVLATAGDLVTLEATEDKYLEYSESGTCSWSFKNTAGELTKYNNPNRSLVLYNILSTQAGTYELTCKDDKKSTYVFEFVVVVENPGEAPTPGALRIIAIIKGVETLQTQKLNMTRDAAVTQCNQAAASIPTSQGVKCTWGSETIFTRVAPTYKIYTIVGTTESLVKTLQGLSKDEALAQCTADIPKIDIATPIQIATQGIKCTWETETIFTRAEPLANGKGVCSHSGETKNVTNVTYTSGLNTCKTSSDSKKCTSNGYKVTCYWNDKLVYKSK